MMKWDEQPLGMTRPAMWGSLPLKGAAATFFTSIFLVIITFGNLLFILGIPIGLYGCVLLYKDNINRPRELMMWIMSGTAFASRKWWGDSFDPSEHKDRGWAQ
jgi:type IV secretory pathway VirB3-like protein